MKFEYDIDSKSNTITINVNDDAYLVIEVDDFWKHVVDYSLNEYCHDYYDPTQENGHGQDSGFLDREEYFKLDYRTIKEDLQEYLTINNYL